MMNILNIYLCDRIWMLSKNESLQVKLLGQTPWRSVRFTGKGEENDDITGTTSAQHSQVPHSLPPSQDQPGDGELGMTLQWPWLARGRAWRGEWGSIRSRTKPRPT